MKWKLGTAAGIGVYVHWSFWLLPAWILLSGAGAAAGLAGALTNVMFVFAIFGCVILHDPLHFKPYSCSRRRAIRIAQFVQSGNRILTCVTFQIRMPQTWAKPAFMATSAKVIP